MSTRGEMVCARRTPLGDVAYGEHRAYSKITAMCACSYKPSHSSPLTKAQQAAVKPLLPEWNPRRAGRPLEFPR
ncbi:hypothetical protein [Kitasatospora griseola]|uniref:hypothetical protein n=1 Tax=Kitasatospora griseola TaxID=2064 RepID=UPI003830ACC7